MFNFNHYVPILRWKAAEKEALALLEVDRKKYISPLFEIIMPNPSPKKKDGTAKTREELLKESIENLKTIVVPKIPNEILKIWGHAPAFIDVNLLDASVRSNCLLRIITESKALRVTLVPILSLNSSLEMYKAVLLLIKKYKQRICLRLFHSDFINASSLAERIQDFLNKFSLPPENIDLILDFQITDELSLKLNSIIPCIPHIRKWGSFTIASGAFPPDLTKLKDPGKHLINRSDWEVWLTQINSGKLIRKPSFSDYTIQHPIYTEPVPGSNPSASIRYTLEDKWMIMRGQGLRSPKSGGHAQYPANAQLLSQQSEFYGSDFSYGDDYINTIGKDIKTKKTGNPKTWLRAGINHHLACVCEQISSLPS